MSSIYGQKPLQDPSNQIRILYVHPGSQNEKIVGSIEVVLRHAAAGSYVAISYAWGSQTRNVPVEIDGQSVYVGYNCWLALWQMRLHGITVPVWMDSICIDQSNNFEKSQQVRIMGSIYASAQITVACLGEGPELAAIIADLEESSALADESNIFPVDRRIPDEESEIIATKWAHLLQLAELPYFSRLWVVQELYHSQEVVLMCGHAVLPWSDLEPFFLDVAQDASTFENRVEYLPATYTSLDNTRLARFIHFRKFRGAQRVFANSSRTDDVTGRGFTGILLSFGEGECHDLRDKVYGLLSLSQDRRWLADFPIDYERPLFRVLLDVVVRLGGESREENVSRLMINMLRWFHIDPSGEAATRVLDAIRAYHAGNDPSSGIFLESVIPFYSTRVWQIGRASMGASYQLPHTEDTCMFFYADPAERVSYMISPFSWMQVCLARGKLVRSADETFWVVGPRTQSGDFIVDFETMRDDDDELSTCLVCRPSGKKSHRLDIVDQASCFADLKVYDKIYNTQYQQSQQPERLTRTEQRYLRTNMLVGRNHDVKFTVFLKAVDLLNMVMLRGRTLQRIRHPILSATSGCYVTREVVDVMEVGSRTRTLVQDTAGHLHLNESGIDFGADRGHGSGSLIL